jgi:hypothetical protein
LAENLFQAATKANNKRALKSLLCIGSLDVNTVMCIANGKKYTPVKQAVYLQELGIVEILLIAKANVNKSFEEVRGKSFLLLPLLPGWTAHFEILFRDTRRLSQRLLNLANCY